MRAMLLVLLVGCGGAVDPAPDAGDEAAVCALWLDPAGGECVDTCTHQIVDAGCE